MIIQLDFRSHTPIYLQIVEQIRVRVTAGQLRPGDQLPTVRQLALDLRVNFNTVARAYRLLDEAGVISTQQGRGTYILQPPPPPSEQHRQRRARLSEMARHYVEEARRLGFTPDEIGRSVQAELQAGPTE